MPEGKPTLWPTWTSAASSLWDAVGKHANRELALAAWEKAKAALSGLGRSTEGIIIHSDQDPVYKSHDYLKQLLFEDGVRISYLARGCKDNPWIESFWGRMKTEIGSQIAEAGTLSELRRIIEERMDYFNTRRRHSRIGNRAPLHYLLTNREDTTTVVAQTGS